MLNFGFSQAQSSWKEINSFQKKDIQKQDRSSTLEGVRIYALDENSFKESLVSLHNRTHSSSSILVLIPNSNGQMEEFNVVESSNFAPELQNLFPEIRAYSGTGITDKQATLYFSVSPKGVQTMVLRADSESEFIERIQNNQPFYSVKKSKFRNKGELPLTCKTTDSALQKKVTSKTSKVNSNNAVFKTYRLALSCTAEYTQYFGSTQNDALAAMNATMTRVNGIFNRDLALKLVLIPNNLDIIYTDADTDPYSPPADGVDNGAWNLELQENLTKTIKNENYDIGHLFGDSGGGGDAGCIGCICINPTAAVPEGKGSAYTSPSNGVPEGDSFDIDFVAHEMGHQLGANHTFSYDIEGTGVNVEPGSGSTIMGYAGITDYDVQTNSDDFFAYASIDQIQANLATKTCGTFASMTNQTPTVNAGLNYTIPKGTAFVLKGSATDPNGDTMTYCWEQNDSASSSETGSNSIGYETKPNGPNFRSFLPSNSLNRFFPSLSKVLAGQLSTTWESVSTVARTMNFVFTARDNASAGIAQTNSASTQISVDASKGPFTVTSQNTADTSWVLGSTQTVKWNVNGTNTLSGSSTVTIKLSTDGGLTFPITLATNTPNDGTESITTPTTAAKNCRILIEPTANVFFAVNSKPFAIGYNVATTCASYPFAAPYSIPDNSVNYTEKTIVVPASDTEITDVNFDINFTHTYLSDLQIDLVSPKGTIVQLYSKSCGATDSTLDLRYDDLGGALDCNATAKQSVVPASVLSAFNGENPGGTWKLRFRDVGNQDIGTINTASLEICSSAYTSLATSNFEITDFILYPNPNKGNFTVQFASSNSADIQIIVTDLVGRKIYNKKFKNTGDVHQNIQLANTSTGIYLVTVIDGDRKGVSKISVE